MAKRKRRKAVSKRKATRRRTARAARPEAFGGAVASLRVLHQELLARRSELDEQIGVIEGALAVVGGQSPPRRPAAPARARRTVRRGGRGMRVGSLKTYIVKVLQGGRTMAVKDITAGVLKAGYKTKNRTLAKSVGAALADLKNVKKVGRGRFRLT